MKVLKSHYTNPNVRISNKYKNEVKQAKKKRKHNKKKKKPTAFCVVAGVVKLRLKERESDT